MSHELQTAGGGNTVEYFIPVKSREWSRFRVGIVVVLGLFALLGAIILAKVVPGSHGVVPYILAALGGAAMFGVNTVAYETPVSGATAPTAVQAAPHSLIGAVVTGDGAATTFTVTHNWALSAAQLALGFPYVDTEVLLAAGNTAAALVTTKGANTVVFTCTAFTGAGLRVRLTRPHTITQ